MQVRVVAYGDLRRYLPEPERDSGALVELGAGATLTQLLDVLRLPYQSAWLVGVNDEIVALDHPLNDGDVIELMLPIGGGGNLALIISARDMDEKERKQYGRN